MIRVEVYGGPKDGEELYLEEVPGVAYYIDTPRFHGLTQYPDEVIARLGMENVTVYVLAPQQRGDILILNWFERIERDAGGGCEVE